MGSPETGTMQPRTRGHCAQQGGLCQQAQQTGCRILVGLSLLAMTMGCRVLPIQVGWDPSLIFDFNKLVRIYFLSMFCFNLCRLL